MGYSVAWVGLRLADPQPLFDAFGVSPAGTVPDFLGLPLVAARLPGGWTVVMANLAAGGDERLFDGSFLSRLSRLGTAVFHCAETSSQDSGVAQWENGDCRWSLVHDADAEDGPLQAAGDLPEPLQSIRVASDPFDVPTKLAAALTGFRHDDPDVEFLALAPAKAAGGLSPTSSCLTPADFEPAAYDLGGKETPWSHGEVPLLTMVRLVAREEEEFLIVRGSNAWFMQAAGIEGGDDLIMIEWQHLQGGRPRHFRLVRAPGPFAGPPPIAFAVDEAHVHLRSFAKLGVPAPGAFLLDVTDDVLGT